MGGGTSVSLSLEIGMRLMLLLLLLLLLVDVKQPSSCCVDNKSLASKTVLRQACCHLLLCRTGGVIAALVVMMGLADSWASSVWGAALLEEEWNEPGPRGAFVRYPSTNTNLVSNQIQWVDFSWNVAWQDVYNSKGRQKENKEREGKDIRFPSLSTWWISNRHISRTPSLVFVNSLHPHQGMIL